MPSICFYFQVHQPFRLRHCSYFNTSRSLDYFDDIKNGQIMRKVAQKSYLPTNRLMLKLIKRYGGAFRIAYSISGVAIEQMRLYAPEVLDSFKALADTGSVEMLAETYYHSLASLYDEKEFRFQVEKQAHLIEETFHQKPRVFRNTELIYDDRIGRLISSLGYRTIIAEGADDVLGWRNSNFVYTLPGTETRLLLKNYSLSDDIAFRFSNRGWKDFPLTAPKFARWIHAISGCGETVNLFMDYETFGEHQWEDTGIFNFLEHMPNEIFSHPHWDFLTPSEVVERYQPRSEMHFHRLTSWADIDRDTTAWQGNRMQCAALQQIYDLGPALRAAGDEVALDVWRKLLTSDHFYYMCTKWFADGDVHAYFSPYESPYDAFINFMNAFNDFRKYYPEQNIVRVEAPAAEPEYSGALARPERRPEVSLQ